MKRRSTMLSLGILLCAGAASAGPPRGHRHDFVFDEESSRLPANDEAPGTSSTGVGVVDIDDDGDLDIFLAEGTAALDPRPNKLYVNDGRGHFTDESSNRLPQGHDANSVQVDFADVNDDGAPDILVANVGAEQLLLNDGAGHFTDASAQLPPSPGILLDISSNVHFADVNGDGCADLLVSNENPFDPRADHGAQNWVWINQTERRKHHHHGRAYRCTGQFVDETAARLPLLSDQTAAMLSGDIDGDRDLDLVVLDRGQEHVLLNDGDGFFTDATQARFPVTTDSTRGGALVDLDRDGALDLVVSNSRNQAPQVYWNDGRGFFSLGQFGFVEEKDETDTALLVADLGRSGYPDVYVGNAGRFDFGHGFEGGPDHFFENQRGSFVEASAKHFTFPAIQASTAAAFGDLDGDGRLDLVVAGTGTGALGQERIFIQRHRHGDDDGCDER